MLKGKIGIIFGVANQRSIAWAIAQALHQAGMKLAFAYQGERLEKMVRKLVDSLGQDCPLYPCDVLVPEQVDKVFENIKNDFGGLDCLVHSIAFANREDLDGRFINTSLDGFRIAHDVSAYSLVALARAAEPLMEGRAGSILAMTYLGGERVIPNYNIMGVAKSSLESCVRYLAWDMGGKGTRVNAISAGPLRTLAAKGISGFSKMTDIYSERAPLKRNIEAEDVGQTALFLSSPMAKNITGEVIHVDAGYHVMGL